MSENLTIEIERIDELPLLLAQLKRMQVSELLDQYFPTHGNWQGGSLGTITSVWLSHIVCEANHRLNQVRQWVKERPHSLQSGLGITLTELDFTDDRLASVLDKLSDDQHWEQFEQALGQHLVRVYRLGEGPVRLDSTAASGYAQVSPDGLFQFGHSKDHRPDLPQLKVQLATLDPLGLPLSSTIVSGERADDGLYVPEIKKVQKTLQSSGLLYVGDCKMAALETRAYLAKSKDYYLCPLSQVQMPSEKLAQLLAPVWTGQQNLSALYQPTPSPSPGEVAAPEVLIGQGYSLERAQKAVVAGEEHTWTERLLVVRSTKWQQAQQHSLQARLEKAQAQIEELNKRKRGKRRWPNRAALEQAVQAILDHFKVAKLVQISYVESLIVHARRRYQTRAADEVVQWSGQVVVAVDAPALVQAEAELGWRVYATNHRESELSLQKAILAYRSEYLVEHNFGRLKGRGLSLQPMYLAIDTRVKGLVRLLTLALRVLSLVEFEVRRQLAEQAESLSGLYAGQPKRSTTRPTTESLLKAFSGLNLSKVVVAGQVHYHVTPLTALQQRILALLGFSTDLYTTLTLHSYQPFLE